MRTSTGLGEGRRWAASSYGAGELLYDGYEAAEEVDSDCVEGEGGTADRGGRGLRRRRHRAARCGGGGAGAGRGAAGEAAGGRRHGAGPAARGRAVRGGLRRAPASRRCASACWATPRRPGRACAGPGQTPGALLASGLAAVAERPVDLRNVALPGAQSDDLERQVTLLLADPRRTPGRLRDHDRRERRHAPDAARPSRCAV